MMISYNTHTETFTVVDIRKTFESFLADLRMIARRTDKWSQEYVERIFYDVVKLAEDRYLKTVDVTLLNNADNKAICAARYTVSLDGKTMKGERAGGNNWPNMLSTHLRVILKYNKNWYDLGVDGQRLFQKEKDFKISWSSTNIDTFYSHLRPIRAQIYASKGYELQRTNFL